MINSFDDNKDHDPGQTEREHEMYDRLDKTKDFPVADGFVSFTQMFRYIWAHSFPTICVMTMILLQESQLQMPQWVP